MKLSSLCYIRKDNQTLMLHRIKKQQDMHAGKWVGLGGKTEKGESPEETAIREVKEESNLQIHSLRLVGILTEPDFKDNEDWYVFVFVSDDFSGDLHECNEGELKWINNSELDNLGLWEGDRLFLKWIDEGKFFTAKFIYKEGVLLKSSVLFH